MALPTLAEFKAYQRIEHSAEDTLLDALLARAQAMVELWTDTPILAASRTAYDPPSAEACAGKPPLTALIFPWRPIGPTVTLVDANGDTVDSTTYRVDQRTGMIYANRAVQFLNPPYAITASVGLQYWDQYSTSLETVIGQVILDLASDLYTRRTPQATAENAAGTNVSWDASRACVERSLHTLKMLKLPVGL